MCKVLIPHKSRCCGTAGTFVSKELANLRCQIITFCHTILTFKPIYLRIQYKSTHRLSSITEKLSWMKWNLCCDIYTFHVYSRLCFLLKISIFYFPFWKSRSMWVSYIVPLLRGKSILQPLRPSEQKNAICVTITQYFYWTEWGVSES